MYEAKQCHPDPGKQRQSVISIKYKLLVLESWRLSHITNIFLIQTTKYLSTQHWTQHRSIVRLKERREEGKEGSEAPRYWVPSGIHPPPAPAPAASPAEQVVEREGGWEGGDSSRDLNNSDDLSLSLSLSLYLIKNMMHSEHTHLVPHLSPG